MVGIDKNNVTFEGLNNTYVNGTEAKFKVVDSSNAIITDVSLEYGGSLTADSEGNYSFTVDGNNKVTATFLDSTHTYKDITIDFQDATVKQSDATKDTVLTATWSEVEFNVVNCYNFVSKQLTYLMFHSKTKESVASISSKNTFGKIAFIQFVTNSGASASAEYKLTLSKEVITTPNALEAVNLGKGITYSLVPNLTDEYKYFSLATTTKANGQVAKLRVIYATD